MLKTAYKTAGKNWLKWESIIFWTLIAVSVFPVLLTPFFPTLDGPAHLYNSRIILELLKGNEVIQNAYLFNDQAVPNWISHFILALLQLIIPSFLAEKVLLLSYAVLLPLSFRSFCLELGHRDMSFLIFPFIYTFLFYLGFYNLSLGFILLFYSLSYWLKYSSNFRTSQLLVLSLLFLLCYFSHLLVYSLLCLSVLLLFIIENHEQLLQSWKRTLRRAMLILLAAMPSLIMFTWFMLSRDFTEGSEYKTARELYAWFKNIQPILAIEYAQEAKLSRFLFYLLALLGLTEVYKRTRAYFRNRTTPQVKLFYKHDFLLLIAVILLILYIVTPYDSGAGMMSDRYLLMFYIFLISWLALNYYPLWLKMLSAAILLMVSTGLVWRYMEYNRSLSSEILAMYEVANKIERNSTVLPIALDGGWRKAHWGNYAGTEKPLIILENYEATTGWFPIKWNDQQIPDFYFGDVKASESCFHWKSNESAGISDTVDYVLLYGKGAIEDNCMAELRTSLGKYYRQLPTTSTYTQLYQLRD